jgi:hypothetical protein
MNAHPSESRADTRRHALRGCGAGFFRHGSGVQWDAKKRPPVIKTIRGLDAPLAHRSLDIPCQVASPQSLTPFLQTIPVYPR